MSARTSLPSIFLDRCADVAPGASKNSVQSTVHSRGTARNPRSTGKRGTGVRLPVQLIAVANLRVAVPISGVCKLERYESRRTRAKPLRAVSTHLVRKRLSNERRQKLVKNDPLIVHRNC